MTNESFHMLIPLLGTILGYIGRMFTTEQMLKSRIERLEKDVNGAHAKIRSMEGKDE
jgi:hypothetical protein